MKRLVYIFVFFGFFSGICAQDVASVEADVLAETEVLDESGDAVSQQEPLAFSQEDMMSVAQKLQSLKNIKAALQDLSVMSRDCSYRAFVLIALSGLFSSGIKNAACTCGLPDKGANVLSWLALSVPGLLTLKETGIYLSSWYAGNQLEKEQKSLIAELEYINLTKDGLANFVQQEFGL